MNGTTELTYNISTGGPNSGFYSVTVVNINRGIYTLVVEKDGMRSETPVNIINLGSTATKDLQMGTTASPGPVAATPTPAGTAGTATPKSPFLDILLISAAICMGAMVIRNKCS